MGFLSLKDMGRERPRRVLAREKQAPESIIFKRSFSVFQTLVLMEKVIRRDHSQHSSQLTVYLNKPICLNKPLVTAGLWCSPCKT